MKDSTVTISGSVMVPDGRSTVIAFAEVDKDKNEITVNVVRGWTGGTATMSPERRFFARSVENLPPGTYNVKVFYGWLLREETIEVKDNK